MTTSNPKVTEDNFGNPLDQFREAAREVLDGSRDCGSCAQGAENCDYHMGVLEAAAGELVIAELEGWYNAYRQSTGLSKYGDLQDPYSAALKDHIAAQRAALNKEDQDGN